MISRGPFQSQSFCDSVEKALICAVNCTLVPIHKMLWIHAYFLKTGPKFQHQDREALCVWDLLGKECALFSKLIYLEKALLYTSAGHGQNIWCFLGMLDLLWVHCRAGLFMSAALPSSAAVCLEMCADCMFLVEKRMFVGKPRHITSLGMADFQKC